MSMAMRSDQIRSDQISIDGTTFSKDQLLTAVAGESKEANFWAIKYSLGTNIRQGNTDQTDNTCNLKMVRRSITNRFVFDSLANYSETKKIKIAKNHRVTSAWDYFLTDRFFYVLCSVNI